MNSRQIKIRSFRAVDHQELAEKFHRGQSEMLKHFQVSEVSSANNQWFFNPSAYALLAEDINGQILGGVRLHLFHSDHHFPLVEATRSVEPDILNIETKDSAESCGIWIDRTQMGLKGLKFILMKSSFALSHSLGVVNLYGLSAPHILNIFQGLGFRVLPRFGNNGNVLYPNPNYTSTFIHLNTRTFENCHPADREEVMNLSRFPNQSRVNEEGNAKLIVHYELICDGARHSYWPASHAHHREFHQTHHSFKTEH